MRLAANAFAAALAFIALYYAALCAIAALGPDGTWTDLAEAVALMAAMVGAGYLAIPKEWR